VDWLVVLIVGVAGFALTMAGAAAAFVADQRRIAEEVDLDEITVGTTERTLTDPEATALVSDALQWTGLGLLVTGLVLAGGAVVYGVTSYRAREDGDALTPRQHERHAAVFGALATMAIAFVPLAQLLGGVAASYRNRSNTDRSVRVGSLSGALVAVPMVVIVVFVGIGTYTGLSVVGDEAFRRTMLGWMLGSAALAALLSTGLGGVGGYVGARLLGEE
jgi:hypothetical protein